MLQKGKTGRKRERWLRKVRLWECSYVGVREVSHSVVQSAPMIMDYSFQKNTKNYH